MAVKWAVASGNWSDGTTWNDGVVPAVGDDVYLDGHSVTVDASFSIGNGTISNGTNPVTTLSGGNLTISVQNTYYITANFECYQTILSASVAGDRFIIGNIKTYSGAYFFNQTSNNTVNITITGNIQANGGFLFMKSASSSTAISITINGNVELTNNTLINGRYGGTKTLTVNGNLSLNNGGISSADTVLLDTCTINGNLSNVYGRTIKATTITITGNIEYASNTGGMGVFASTLNVGNSATFIWKDVTEPRSNPFIILTDAEMNNHQQYPPEYEVKQGTEYVWGEKVGTYQQPPESVVLSGYEYDTITAEENDIATYNAVRYIYADYGTLHWFELKTTTTDIVTTPSQQSITIGGETVVADTDYVVEYNDVCYQWSGGAWGSITTKNIGTVKTDIVTKPTETTLGVKKGTLETIPQATLSRMQNALTVDIFQQILDAHLNN